MYSKLEARLQRQLEKLEFSGPTKYVELEEIYAPKPSTFWVHWEQAIEAMELQAAATQDSGPSEQIYSWSEVVAHYYARDAEDALRDLMERHMNLKSRRGPAYWLSDLKEGARIAENDTEGPSSCRSTQRQPTLPNTTQSVAPAPGEPIITHGNHSEAHPDKNGDTPKAIRIAREVQGIFAGPNRGRQQLVKAQAARSARVASKSPANQILRRNPNHAQPVRKLRQATQTKV